MTQSDNKILVDCCFEAGQKQRADAFSCRKIQREKVGAGKEAPEDGFGKLEWSESSARDNYFSVENKMDHCCNNNISSGNSAPDSPRLRPDAAKSSGSCSSSKAIDIESVDAKRKHLESTTNDGARMNDNFNDSNCGANSNSNSNCKDLDSGYAWVILCIMFLLQASISGSTRVYGIVYAEQVALGYYDREQASWPIATASTIENLTGILTPALVQYLSWRKIELLSTSLLILSNLLAYFSDSLPMDIFALGITQGIALSISTVLSLAINNDYFERFRTTAYGLTLSGSFVGVLYLNPMVTYILNEYGDFRLVYLALAFNFCFNIILVLFIRPRVKETEEAAAAAATTTSMAADGLKKPEARSLSVALDKQSAGLPKEPAPSRTRKVSTFERHLERQHSIASISYIARSRRQSTWILGGGGFGNESINSMADSYNNCDCCNNARDDKSAPENDNNGGLSKSQSGKDVKVGRQFGANLTLASVRSSPTLAAATAVAAAANNGGPTDDMTNCRNQSSAPNERRLETKGRDLSCHKEQTLNCGRPSLARLSVSSNYHRPIRDGTPLDSRDSLDTNQNDSSLSSIIMRLLKTPYLHCVWIMLAMYYLIARIFIIILVDFVHDHGFSLDDSSALLTYWSVGELIGRVLLGSLIDLKWTNCKNCISITCFILSSSIVLMVYYENYYIYAVCSCITAAFISLEYMLINVLMIEYLGKENVTSCYALAAFICSIVLATRPYLIGLFRDHLGSYDGLLLLLAAISFSYAIMFQFLEPVFVRYWPKLRVDSEEGR